MKADELFGVVVRTIGLLCVINGAWYLIYGFLQSAGTFGPSLEDETAMYFASGIPFMAGGCLLMRGADWFVKFSYPSATKSETEVGTGRPGDA
jgi:hypothetical protein